MPTVPPVVTGAAPASRNETLRQTAEKLETAFLSEMLKAAGLGKAREAFGGGVGEEQFASFLRDEQAKAMVRAGGLGLAENIVAALEKRTGYAE